MCCEDSSTKAWLVSTEAMRPLQYPSRSPFISSGLDEAGAVCIRRPVTVSKHVRVNELQRGWWISDLEGPNHVLASAAHVLAGPNCSAFGQVT